MKVFVMPVAYIDLNHFINMAQGIKRGNDSLFNRLWALVQAKKVAIPASAMLIMEVWNVKKPQQRDDIGHVLKRLCDRLVIRDYDDILRMEVRNKVSDYYGKQRDLPLPLMAFAVGYAEVFGPVRLTPRGQDIDPEKSAEVLEFCKRLLEKADILDPILAQHLPKYPEGGWRHNELVEATRRTRLAAAGKSFEKLKREYIHHMLGTVRRQFDDAATALGIVVNGLHPVMPDEFRTTQFLESIPSIHVWSDLHLFLYHRNQQAAVELNDLYDISQLAVAVPYCDVVVCDKKMCAVLGQSGLDKKYGTKIFSKLSEAVDFLEALSHEVPS